VNRFLRGVALILAAVAMPFGFVVAAIAGGAKAGAAAAVKEIRSE
jgi:phosphoribosylcarboxyaminoimidazole (NCAIR) mutase